MIYAHVVNGFVVNRILWDGVGDAPVDEGELVPIEQAAGVPDLPAPEPVVIVPSKVEGHLCRVELIVRGDWPAVLAVIEQMTEPTRSIANEALYAPYFSRNSPTMAAIAAVMGWSSADIDARFIGAASRVV